MIRNERSFTTWHDNIDAYEEYFLSKNFPATYLDSTDWTELQAWLRKKLMGLRSQQSPITTEHEVKEEASIDPKSPFEAIEDRLSEDEKVYEIIKFLNDQINITFSKRLANRIQFLIEASKEEYPDEVAILPESLKNFVSFLQAKPNLKYPDVVLSPSKNIRAQWRTAPNRHFAVEFLPTGDAHFVIFTPDPKHPDKTNRMSGIVSVDSLMPTAQPQGVLSWCS